MNPYGVAQSYCEAPPRLGSVAPYIEPIPYAALKVEAIDLGKLLDVQANPYIVASPYVMPEPYGATEVIAYSNGDADQALTFSETATGGAVGKLTHVTYGVEIPYTEPYPYVGLPSVVTTYKAEDFLSFSETGKTDLEQGTDDVSFTQEASVIHDASDTLVFSAPTYDVTSDTLTFSEAATFVHNTTDLLAFGETAEYIHAVVSDGLAFSESADYVRDQSDALIISDEAAQIHSREDAPVFSETAAVIFAAFDTISFADPIIPTIPSNHLLSFIQEASWVVTQGAKDSLTFIEEVSWNRTRQEDEEHSLRFYEAVTFRTPRLVGGSGYNPMPPHPRIIDHLTVGSHKFRMGSDYTVDTAFTNGKYLNAGTKYNLPLSRPLEVVGDWQFVLKALIGTQQTVTNLGPVAFEAYITDESVLTSEGIDLVFYALYFDTRGYI